MAAPGGTRCAAYAYVVATVTAGVFALTTTTCVPAIALFAAGTCPPVIGFIFVNVQVSVAGVSVTTA